MTQDDWSEHKLLILKELESLNNKVQKLYDIASVIREDITILKFKAGLWGLIGAAIPTIAAVLFIKLK